MLLKTFGDLNAVCIESKETASASVEYCDPSCAQYAVQALNGHYYKGHILQARIEALKSGKNSYVEVLAKRTLPITDECGPNKRKRNEIRPSEDNMIVDDHDDLMTDTNSVEIPIIVDPNEFCNQEALRQINNEEKTSNSDHRNFDQQNLSNAEHKNKFDNLEINDCNNGKCNSNYDDANQLEKNFSIKDTGTLAGKINKLNVKYRYNNARNIFMSALTSLEKIADNEAKGTIDSNDDDNRLYHTNIITDFLLLYGTGEQVATVVDINASRINRLLPNAIKTLLPNFISYGAACLGIKNFQAKSILSKSEQDYLNKCRKRINAAQKLFKLNFAKDELNKKSKPITALRYSHYLASCACANDIESYRFLSTENSEDLAKHKLYMKEFEIDLKQMENELKTEMDSTGALFQQLLMQLQFIKEKDMKIQKDTIRIATEKLEQCEEHSKQNLAKKLGIYKKFISFVRKYEYNDVATLKTKIRKRLWKSRQFQFEFEKEMQQIEKENKTVLAKEISPNSNKDTVTDTAVLYMWDVAEDAKKENSNEKQTEENILQNVEEIEEFKEQLELNNTKVSFGNIREEEDLVVFDDKNNDRELGTLPIDEDANNAPDNPAKRYEAACMALSSLQSKSVLSDEEQNTLKKLEKQRDNAEMKMITSERSIQKYKSSHEITAFRYSHYLASWARVKYLESHEFLTAENEKDLDDHQLYMQSFEVDLKHMEYELKCLKNSKHLNQELVKLLKAIKTQELLISNETKRIALKHAKSGNVSKAESEELYRKFNRYRHMCQFIAKCEARNPVDLEKNCKDALPKHRENKTEFEKEMQEIKNKFCYLEENQLQNPKISKKKWYMKNRKAREERGQNAKLLKSEDNDEV